MYISIFMLIAFSFLTTTDILLTRASESKSAVSKLTESIHLKGKPCEDFYDYACGNWKSYHPKPPDKNSWGVFDEILINNKNILYEILDEPIQEQDTLSLKSSKTLFKGCMQEEPKDAKTFQEIIQNIGGWPMLNASWDPNQYDWWDVLTNIRNKFGLSLLFKVALERDFSSSDDLKNVIYVDQGNLFVQTQLLLQISANKMVEYQNVIKKVAQEFASPAVQTTNLDKKIADIVQFEIDLAKILSNGEERRGTSGIGISTVEDTQTIYQSIMPTFPIKLDKYLTSVFSKSGVTLLPSEKIIIWEKLYLARLFNLISNTPIETVANYLVWRVIGSLAYYSNSAIRDEIFTLVKGEPKNETCLSLAYGPGVAQKYLERHFDSSTKEKIENFTEIIEKITIKFIIDSSLDASIKLKAIIKRSQINACIGYPEWLTNSSLVDQHYYPLKDLVNFSIYIKSDNGKLEFLDRALLVLQERSDQTLAESRKPFVKNCEWSFLGTEDEYYSPYSNGRRNTINFPMGVLQPPIFTKDAPQAMNFGSLGTVLGRQIAYSLSNIGWTKNDSKGNLSNIGKCLVDEYRSLSFSSLQMIVEDRSSGDTLNDDFQDNVGLQMAYHAYKYYANSSESNRVEMESFTSDQIFFLAFAQNYCEVTDEEAVTAPDSQSTGKYRVLGSLRNFPEFAKAWKCPTGSYMNPISKCNIFNGENNTIS